MLRGQVRPDSTLNEEAARLVAYRQGIRIILAGSAERAGGYRLVDFKMSRNLESLLEERLLS